MPSHLLRLRGLVQGVGFRPYVWRLANELGLRGWVKNDAAGVLVAVDGEKTAEFIRRLPVELPPLARIDQIEAAAGRRIEGAGFRIEASSSGEIATTIGPDAAICPDCIADICDLANRRWRYAFTTCTHCGPRYSVSRKIPYDRANTSLAEFPLCPACQAEYAALPDEKLPFSAVDRRFHAETIACPNCGPQLQLLDAAGQPLAGDPLAETLRLLQDGKIVAIKGLGGFHLACDARNAAAVAELRLRKQREEKPFAVMGLNGASLNGASFSPYVRLGNDELALLHRSAAPIVLCPKIETVLPGAESALTAALAPGLASLGVMLPATPLHLLIWHEAAGRPIGTAWTQEKNPLLLVMTSANPQGEPLVIDNTEALSRLAGIADAFLLHDRAIVVRCDDSVVRAGASGATFIRCARGYAPLPIALATDGPAVLSLGGHLKNTVCVMKGRQAFLSQHIGGLDNAPAIAFLEESVQHLLRILEVRPQLIAHDLHPDYASTHLALQLAAELGVPAIAVPHHQAHLAALAAEHGIEQPLLGLALDGVGLGPDGRAWGGELLRLDGAHCQALGQLSPLKLPGADRAAREPWRMGLAALHAAGMSYRIGGWLKQHYPEREGGPLITMLDRNLRCPPTSSLGRWFDAAAGLLGVREMAHYEGQAAMELEALAVTYGPVPPLKNGFLLHTGQVDFTRLDFTPLIPALLVCHDKAEGAALFHATVAAGLAAWALSAVNAEKQTKIAIAGGCALNAVLTDALRQHLANAGVELLEARQAPPNDGGLALGQAWVARQQFNAVQ